MEPNESFKTTMLWWHLFEEHKMPKSMLHGDPSLMHEAAHRMLLYEHVHILGDFDE